MKRIIALTVLSSLILCFAISSISFACTGYNNYLSAERYAYPLDGDDAYAKTYGTSCGSSWSNALVATLEIKYEEDGPN